MLFDPHITVHEFGVTSFERRGGGKWWSERELEEFKKEAIQRIRSRCATIVPTGTGRSLAVPPSLAGGGGGGGGAAGGAGNVSFNHPALGCEDEYDPRELPAARDDAIVGHLSQEIRNILVVDPHVVFLELFRKSLKHMIPHAAGEFLVRYYYRGGGGEKAVEISLVFACVSTLSFSLPNPRVPFSPRPSFFFHRQSRRRSPPRRRWYESRRRRGPSP